MAVASGRDAPTTLTALPAGPIKHGMGQKTTCEKQNRRG